MNKTGGLIYNEIHHAKEEIESLKRFIKDLKEDGYQQSPGSVITYLDERLGERMSRLNEILDTYYREVPVPFKRDSIRYEDKE